MGVVAWVNIDIVWWRLLLVLGLRLYLGLFLVQIWHRAGRRLDFAGVWNLHGFFVGVQGQFMTWWHHDEVNGLSGTETLIDEMARFHMSFVMK